MNNNERIWSDNSVKVSLILVIVLSAVVETVYIVRVSIITRQDWRKLYGK